MFVLPLVGAAVLNPHSSRAATLVVDDTSSGAVGTPKTFSSGTASYTVIRAGNEGHGTLNQTGGTLIATSNYGVGIGTGSVGNDNLSGGTLTLLGGMLP